MSLYSSKVFVFFCTAEQWTRDLNVLTNDLHMLETYHISYGMCSSTSYMLETAMQAASAHLQPPAGDRIGRLLPQLLLLLLMLTQ